MAVRGGVKEKVLIVWKVRANKLDQGLRFRKNSE